MGCFITKSSSKRPIISHKSDLQIRPATFIPQRSQSFIKTYQVAQQLGRGAYSTVYKCIHKQFGLIRAVKFIQKQKLNDQHFISDNCLKQIEFLKMLDHPNILRVFQIFQDLKRFYIVMQYVSGGELFDTIIKQRSFTQQEAADISYQLFSAINYCHSRNIIHRDIKPQNILIEQYSNRYHIKIADFGNSIVNSFKKHSGSFGSMYYIAPEVLRNEFDQKCDVWSSGVILYILLYGSPPFNGRKEKDVLANIRGAPVRLKASDLPEVSQLAQDLISSVLKKDPTERISANQVLKHQWFIQFKPKVQSSVEKLQEVMTSLTAFNSSVKLRNAIVSFISSQLVTQEYTFQLKNIFQMLDRNGDGRISRDELLEIYKEVFGIDSNEHVTNIMENVDTDKNGFIDYSEFVQATLDSEILFSRKNLETAFQTFDIDGSGSISAKELREMLSQGRVSSDRVWEEIIKEADQNGDGEVDLKEFTQLVLTRI